MPGLTKIRMNKRCRVVGVSAMPGDEIDVPDDVARTLCDVLFIERTGARINYAERVEAPAKAFPMERATSRKAGKRERAVKPETDGKSD